VVVGLVTIKRISVVSVVGVGVRGCRRRGAGLAGIGWVAASGRGLGATTERGWIVAGEGYGVHLGGDRALDDARALGYPLDARADASWPGLEGSAQLRLRPEVVGDLAGELGRRAESASGLADRLARATAGVRFGPSSWHEANNLAEASRQVREAVQGYVTGLLHNLSEAGRLMAESNTNYADAEQANSQAVQAAGAGLGDGSGDGSGEGAAGGGRGGVGGDSSGSAPTPVW
jgi:hypothetical protein